MPAQVPRKLNLLGFGREIRRRRQALGMTLEQLAERAGLTPNYVGSVEMGRRDPSLSTIFALAKGLQSSPPELLGGLGEQSSLAVEAGRLLDSSPPEMQHAVLQLLRVMLRRVGAKRN
jgi:transcriptional regulator with XRE-family HTH domain